MSEAILSKFIFNDMVYEVSQFDNTYVFNTPSVYEVIRIFDGTPLFLESHYERLINSGALLGFDINETYDNFKKNITKMMIINAVKNFNIKIVINNLNQPTLNICYFFIKSEYPSIDLYENGIKTFTYMATRDKPNAKVMNKDLRTMINVKLSETSCYEAILVNEKVEVTEGSRSNLFFIKNQTVYTAPAKDVLLGITRERIISLCKNNNINIEECPIPLHTIAHYNACFISGTSPKVLPINTIDNVTFEKNNALLEKIVSIYNTAIDEYIIKNR